MNFFRAGAVLAFSFLLCGPLSAGTPQDLFLTASEKDNPLFEIAARRNGKESSPHKVEIRYLIEAVRKSPLKFIRNGEEHGGMKAASHLSWKYSFASSRVKSTREFIDEVASQSMISGSSYMVKNAEGEVYPLKDVLRNELARLERALPASS